MTNEQKQTLMRERAAALMKDGAVSYVIGWRETRFPGKTAIFFVRDEKDADMLVWDEYTIPLTAKYLTENRWPDKKIGIFARGCDSKAINRLISDNQVERENLYIIGLPCEGKKDDRCLSCTQRDPLIYDELLWEPENATGTSETDLQRARFFRAEEVESLPTDARFAHWEDVYARCIRCYACRNVCPVCTCRECYVDMHRTGFQGKHHDAAENRVFGVTRAFHVGDRCIECGECERVCPMGLPILGQTQKIIKTIEGLAGTYEAGMDPEADSFLGKFDLDDKDTFM
ncbi:MAG: 4Fe-4S dicluster domain-containing protein [Clostridiales bacterium]|nr:4Fe-4S dicluster domain-containing protein [Clostridiales bacterium]